MRFKLALIILFSLTLIFTFSCKKEKKQPEKTVHPTINEEKPELKVFPLPTPYEVTEIITKAKVSFDKNLLNSTEKDKDYLTTKAQALNMGIYGTDLSYANVFNQSLIVKEYFNAIKYLADELGLNLLFTDDFLTRIDENINNPDSLYKIATESYYKTYSYLVDRGKSDVASVVLAGSFVEGLFLALKSAEKASDPQIIYTKVAEQKFASQQLVNLLDKHAQLSDMAREVLEEIRPIDAILRKVKYENDTPVFSTKDIEMLKTAVYKTRSKFVNLE